MSQDGNAKPYGEPSAKQEYAKAEHAAWNITGYLLAGPIAWGGIGWLCDRWLGTAFLLPVGLVLGMVLALYRIWVSYGKS